MPQKLTPQIISAAIAGFEQQKLNIDSQLAELRAMLNGAPTESADTPEESPRKRRKMSAAGRKAIAKAQRKRWAAAKKQSEPPALEAPKPKRKLSAAGRRNIIAATKMRWDKVRAAKAQQQKTSKKPTAKRSKKAAATAAPPAAQAGA